ncbi:MAG TPA: hypothetical protein VGJ77_17720 [Gaiellaceae bacterium]
MPTSTAIDVAIGLALVYFIFAIAVSAINETIATALGWRAKFLRKGLINILSRDPAQLVDAASKIRAGAEKARGLAENAPATRDASKSTEETRPKETPWWRRGWWEHPGFGDLAMNELLRHPLISPQVRYDKNGNPRKRYPSYLPSRTFIAAIMAVAREAHAAAPPPPDEPDVSGMTDAAAKQALRKHRQAVREHERREFDAILDHLPGDRLRGAFKALHQRAEDVTHFEALAEQWYDDSMERVSGWYKRRAQVMIWGLGLLLALVMNVDTIRIGRALWNDKPVRDAVVQQARRVALTPPEDKQGKQTEDQLKTAADSVSKLEKLKVPMGWSGNRPKGWGWGSKLLGLVLTGAALSLGAPFWFDLLSKVARLRSSGAPPPATKAVRHGEGEETRAGPGATVTG